MNREIKISSNEGGPFTSSQNRVSFTIPGNAVYDMSQAYINLNTTFTPQENETVSGNGVYILDLHWASTDNNHPQFFNSSVVKNCSISSARNGQIENIRRVDLLSNILKTYNSSMQEQKGRAYKSASQNIEPVNEQQYSIYRDINKLGNVKSKANNNASIKIMLSDLFDFCFQADELDTNKTGDLRVDLELNMDKLQAKQRMPTAQLSTGSLAFNDLTTAGDLNTVTTKVAFETLDQSPYYTGLKVQISATGAGTGPPPAIANARAVVETITQNANGTLTLTFENNWGNLPAGGGSYIDVQVSDVEDLASASVNVNFAEIVLLDLAKNSSDFDEIEYCTYSTEETNGNGLTSYQNQFQVEPEADALVVIHPMNENGLIAKGGTFASHRIRQDQVDLTDRNVETDSPLYYDRINMTMTQMKMKVKNLKENNGNTSKDEYPPQEASSQQEAIMSPLNQTPREKYVQVNIEAKAGQSVNSLALFKHLPRVFKY